MVKTTAVSMFVTAPQGAGKTYRRGAHYVFNEWLPEHDGVHYSSFPWRLDPYDDPVTGETCKGLVLEASETYAMAESEVRRRVQTIPAEELETWAVGESGPWEYFQTIYDARCIEAGVDPEDPENGVEHPLAGAHVAIDEAHIYYPRQPRGLHKQAVKRCMEWLAEIRHQGATVEFITQYEYQIAPEIRNLCAAHVQLTNLENDREPLTGAMVGDWLQMLAKFVTGKYQSYVREELYTQDGKVKTKKESGVYALEPKYFALYDSYSKPHKGGKAGQAKGRQWETKSTLGFLVWFVGRNWFNVGWRAAFACVLVWLCFLGGAGVLMEYGSARLAATLGQQVEPGPRANLDKVGGVDEPVDAEQLAMELSIVTQRMHDAERERDELAKRLGDAGSLVLVTMKGITFRNGDHYGIGEKIEFGPYRGRHLDGVDWRRRVARLDDGTLLRLASDVGTDSGMFGAGQNARSGAGVPTALQRTSTYGSESPQPTPARADANNERVRYANEPIRSVRVEPDGGVGGTSVLVRPAAGNGGSGQSAPVGSAWGGSQASGSPTRPETEYVLPRVPASGGSRGVGASGASPQPVGTFPSYRHPPIDRR